MAARRASVMKRYGFDRLVSDIVAVYQGLLGEAAIINRA
jgi:hypothetical protein